jgi:hypothetical protein
MTGVIKDIADLKNCDFLGEKGKVAGNLLKSLDTKLENQELKI